MASSSSFNNRLFALFREAWGWCILKRVTPEATEMNLRTVVDVLNARVDELSVSSSFCGLGQDMVRHREIERLIKACGHDTSELQQAIDAADKAMRELTQVRDKVVTKFKLDGVCFIVDESKRAEIERSTLQ